MPTQKKQNNVLFKKFSLSTTKSKVIASIVIFAVVGGAFMVLKSFASTAAVTYLPTNGGISNKIMYGNCITGLKYYSQPNAKGTIPMLAVNCPAKSGANVYASTVFNHPSGDGQYHACVRYANALGPSELQLIDQTQNTIAGRADIKPTSAGAIQSVCTPVYNAGHLISNQLSVRVLVNGNSQSTVASSIWVQWLVIEPVEGTPIPAK